MSVLQWEHGKILFMILHNQFLLGGNMHCRDSFYKKFSFANPSEKTLYLFPQLNNWIKSDTQIFTNMKCFILFIKDFCCWWILTFVLVFSDQKLMRAHRARVADSYERKIFSRFERVISVLKFHELSNALICMVSHKRQWVTLWRNVARNSSNGCLAVNVRNKHYGRLR